MEVEVEAVLDCVLGQGGQGNVYSAVHIYTNLPVAVKVVDKRKVKTWDLLQGRSVPREFKLLYQLQGQITAGRVKMREIISLLQTWRESSNTWITTSVKTTIVFSS